MPLTSVSQAEVICHASDGHEVARLFIVPVGDSPLARLDIGEARASGEAEVQLAENGRYEYRLTSAMSDLRVSCPPIFKPNHLQQGAGEYGLIETGSLCGQMRIEIVRATAPSIIGSAALEVRSVKLGYRDDYRWMLDDIARRMMQLLFDARAPATMPLTAAWTRDPAALQQQLAFLCETLESPEFHAAIQRVLASPHQRLTPEMRTQPIQRAFRTSRHLERQLMRGGQQVRVPASHPLTQRIAALPAHTAIPIKRSDLDTSENQFVKHALDTFRAFLLHAEVVMRKQGGEGGEGGAWGMPASRARRAANQVDHWLTHACFQEVSPLRAMPFGSHALQRKAGYRDVLGAWLRFHAGAKLIWDASDDLFRAGQRNAAALYEYWLFFQLLDWFCQRFDVATSPTRLLVTRDADKLICALRHGATIGPFEGAQGGVRAQLRYNHTFDARDPGGSWTRPMRPDFTLTFWRADAPSAPIHLHFDAKYRVEKLSDAFDVSGDDVDNGNPARRDDLLKMHAYRDAIRNTAGAYVLYPGDGKAAPVLMRRDDGVLPSLGAFAVRPGPGGKANGMAHVAEFLEEVMHTL